MREPKDMGPSLSETNEKGGVRVRREVIYPFAFFYYVKCGGFGVLKD